MPSVVHLYLYVWENLNVKSCKLSLELVNTQNTRLLQVLVLVHETSNQRKVNQNSNHITYAEQK